MKKWGRFLYNGREYRGVFEGGGTIAICGAGGDVEKRIGLDGCKVLSPVEPPYIICIGLNYKQHAAELGMELPKSPVVFLKPQTSIIGPFDDILLPRGVGRVDFEGEIAVVMKEICSREEDPDVIASKVLGITAVNDVTAREVQQADGQWTRAKSFDTFCPIGDGIMEYDIRNTISIRTILNGKVVQSSSTEDMIFSIVDIIKFVSSFMTLRPYDIISTGTPVGVGPLNEGDVITIELNDGEIALTNRARRV